MKLIKTKLLIGILVLLVFLDCGLGAYIMYWREGFWQAVVNKELYQFFYYIAIFAGVALASCGVTAYIQYLGSIVALNIRTKLTRKALKLSHYETIEGGAQRVQEDCLSYPTLILSLSGGILRSITMILTFGVIIYLTLPVKYMIIPVLYTMFGTFIAYLIAKPLIKLNYINQQFEAKFRKVLTLISETTKKTAYKDVHRNNYNLFKRTKYLNMFQTFYNQITVVIPYLLLASLYFSAIITFGSLMQLASGLIECISQASYLINSFGDINKFLAARRRLKEMRII